MVVNPTFMRSSVGTMPTSISGWLPLVEDQLVLVTGLDSTRVLITAMDPDETPHYGADKDVLVKLLGERPAGSAWEGSGRVDNRRVRTVRVTVRTRAYLDQFPADKARLLDMTVGHILLEDAAYDAMCWFMPTDQLNNVLAVGGECQHIEDCRRERPANKATGGDGNWLISSFTVDFEYTRALDQSRQ